MNTETMAEQEELQEQARATAQLSQADRMTMQGHLRNKLKIGRSRLRKTWGLEGTAEPEEDMQILARDMTFIQQAPEARAPEARPTEAAVQVTQTTKGASWPLWAATMLGLAVPGTVGVAMLPWIIEALYPPTAVERVEPTEYIPILLPGKPGGAN